MVEQDKPHREKLQKFPSLGQEIIPSFWNIMQSEIPKRLLHSLTTVVIGSMTLHCQSLKFTPLFISYVALEKSFLA
jgi:hypothetical protein